MKLLLAAALSKVKADNLDSALEEAELLLEIGFYAGFKATHHQLNGEIPYVVKEHEQDISCSDQIDKCKSVRSEFLGFIDEIKKQAHEKVS